MPIYKVRFSETRVVEVEASDAEEAAMIGYWNNEDFIKGEYEFSCLEGVEEVNDADIQS